MEGDCVTRSDKNRVSVAERFPTRDVWRIEIENMLANDKPIKSDPNTKIRKSNHFQWNQKTTKSKVSENASKENRGRKKRCKMSNSKQEGGEGVSDTRKEEKNSAPFGHASLVDRACFLSRSVLRSFCFRPNSIYILFFSLRARDFLFPRLNTALGRTHIRQPAATEWHTYTHT